MKDINNVTILGAGAWGTSLAAHLAGKGLKTTLWMREEEVRLSIEESRVNTLFLPGVTLPENLIPTNDLEASVKGCPDDRRRGPFARHKGGLFTRPPNIFQKIPL